MLILIALGIIAGAWIVSRFIGHVITYAGTVCALPDCYGDVIELPVAARKTGGRGLHRATTGTQKGTALTHSEEGL